MLNKYICMIDESLKNANNYVSNITRDIILMEGMSGTKTRHFYNNLLKYEDVRYLEIGTWKGSSVCSAMCNNNATIVCIDNWSEFGGPKNEFLNNFNKYRGKNNAIFYEHNCFTLDISQLPKFNIYMYDGEHTKESQYKALTHYYDCLDEIFIFIVDDWNCQCVRDGTNEAIKFLNLKVMYEIEIKNNNNVQTAEKKTWWNGIYISILQKN